MRVLVDTSARVDFFNGHPSAQADALSRLIREEADVLTCGLVAAEVMQGIRQSKTKRRIERQFRDMEWLTPVEPDTYLSAIPRGDCPLYEIDCIIAKLADENDAALLSKDRDLQRIADSRILGLRMLPLP